MMNSNTIKSLEISKNRRLTTQSPKTPSIRFNTKKIPKEFKPYRYDHTTQNIKNQNFKNTSNSKKNIIHTSPPSMPHPN